MKKIIFFAMLFVCNCAAASGKPQGKRKAPLGEYVDPQRAQEKERERRLDARMLREARRYLEDFRITGFYNRNKFVNPGEGRDWQESNTSFGFSVGKNGDQAAADGSPDDSPAQEKRSKKEHSKTTGGVVITVVEESDVRCFSTKQTVYRFTFGGITTSFGPKQKP